MSEWKDKISRAKNQRSTGIGFNSQTWYETWKLAIATNEPDIAPEHSMQLFRKERDRVGDSLSQTSLIQPCSAHGQSHVH